MATPPLTTVPNRLFPHIGQPTIAIQGDLSALNPLIDVLNRGFQADDSQTTVYDAIANYINKYLISRNNAQATESKIRDCYYSEGVRELATANLAANTAEAFNQAHSLRHPRTELGSVHRLLPLVFQHWLEKCINKEGGCPVNRVGVVTRQVSDGQADRFEVKIHRKRTTHVQDICIWFVFDSDPESVRPWAALIPSSSPPEILISPVAVALPTPTTHHLSQRPHVGSIGPATGARSASTFSAGLFQRPVPSPAYDSRASPTVRPAVPSVPFLPNTPSVPISPFTPNVSSNLVAGDSDVRAIAGAPAWNTALPWDLLADCTLEEILIYYPNHVLNYPGLALLYAHYSHRIVGENWTHMAVAKRLSEAWNLSADDVKVFAGKLRQWVAMAGSELTKRLNKDELKKYDPEEYTHYSAIYALVKHSQALNVQDVLQRILQQLPARLASGPLQPTMPLHQVGQGIRGTHPRGQFANRVQAAMQAHRNGVADPMASIEVPMVAEVHPMISLLVDATRTLEERKDEVVANYNKTVDDDRWIRPLELLPLSDKTRYFARKPEEIDGQIWEFMDDGRTVIDYLQARWTREQLIEEHWRDLHRDAWLWINMEMGTHEIVAKLPNAAKLEFGILKDTPKKTATQWQDAWKTSKRKTKQMSIEARLRGCKGSGWDQKKTAQDAVNKRLYNQEKERFDEWAKQNKRSKGKPTTKRPRGDDDDAEHDRLTKRPAPDPQLPTPKIEDVDMQGLQDLFGKPVTPREQRLQRMYTYDTKFLWNVDADNNFQLIARTPFGMGSVPEWWRLTRVNALGSHGVTIDRALLDLLFDQGIDVVPEVSIPGTYLELPGDFGVAPSFSPSQIGQSLPSPSMMTFGAELPDLTNDIFPPSICNNGLANATLTFDNSAAGELPVNVPELPDFSAIPHASQDETEGVEMGSAEMQGRSEPNVDFHEILATAGQAEAFNAAISEQQMEQPSVTAAAPAPRRRSPRGHDTGAPRRRSPRNHSGSLNQCSLIPNSVFDRKCDATLI